jgi:hypothetical protein
VDVRFISYNKNPDNNNNTHLLEGVGLHVELEALELQVQHRGQGGEPHEALRVHLPEPLRVVLVVAIHDLGCNIPAHKDTRTSPTHTNASDDDVPGICHERFASSITAQTCPAQALMYPKPLALP